MNKLPTTRSGKTSRRALTKIPVPPLRFTSPDLSEGGGHEGEAEGWLKVLLDTCGQELGFRVHSADMTFAELGMYVYTNKPLSLSLSLYLYIYIYLAYL